MSMGLALYTYHHSFQTTNDIRLANVAVLSVYDPHSRTLVDIATSIDIVQTQVVEKPVIVNQ